MKRRRQRNKRKKVPVPIASMGDIAFLLIIFFLVCSDIARDNSNVQVKLPYSEYVEKNEANIAARVAIDTEGQIYLDGVKVPSAKDIEWGVRAILTNTVTDDQRHVQFKCDASLPKEQFEPVLKAIAEAGGIIDAVGEEFE